MSLTRWLCGVGVVTLVLVTAISSAAQTIEDLKKGVVKITAQADGNTKVGTGFIVRLETDTVYVLTAAHVVRGDPKPSLTFYMQQDTQYSATVRNAEENEERGLAILVAKLPPAAMTGIAALALDTTTKLSGGEEMLTIGFPRTGGQWAVIKGNVTSREGRNLNIDANIQEGNSGGPIIHGGRVVGLVTARGSNYGSGVTAASAHDYLEGFNVTPRAASARDSGAASSAPAARNSVEQPQRDLARRFTGKDGAPMVLVPAGEFWMGSSDDPSLWKASPRHRVTLSTFYLDKYEVTNRHFQQFVQQNGYHTTGEQKGKAWVFTVEGIVEELNGANWLRPEGRETVFDSRREEHPVVSVSWNDAQAYCRWVGKRLPTEAEFEYATRAGTETRYWWGNGSPGSRRVENLADESLKRQYPKMIYIMSGYTDGYVRTAPVGSFEPNPFGLHDLAGNVSEWTSDCYDSNYYKDSPERNPKGPSCGNARVNRGGSWYQSNDTARSANRNFNGPSELYFEIGFRCAQDVPN